jgi:hypothetical protein
LIDCLITRYFGEFRCTKWLKILTERKNGQRSSGPNLLIPRQPSGIKLQRRDNVVFKGLAQVKPSLVRVSLACAIKSLQIWENGDKGEWPEFLVTSRKPKLVRAGNQVKNR